jgi:hypothetical protein
MAEKIALFWVDHPEIDAVQSQFIFDCIPDGWRMAASTDPHDFAYSDAVIIPPFHSFHEFADLSMTLGSMLSPHIPFAISVLDGGNMPVPPELTQRPVFKYFQFDGWMEPEPIKAWLASLSIATTHATHLIEELCSLLDSELIKNAELKKLIEESRTIKREQRERINDLELEVKQLEYVKSFLEEELRKSQASNDHRKLMLAVIPVVIASMISVAGLIGNTALEAHLKDKGKEVAAKCEEVKLVIDGNNNTVNLPPDP